MPMSSDSDMSDQSLCTAVQLQLQLQLQEGSHRPTGNGNGPTSKGVMSPPPSPQMREHNGTAGSCSPLKNRVAIVTGGSGGIGSAIATHLAALGAKVVIGYVGDPTPADRLVSAINSSYAAAAGRSAVAVEADVSDEGQVKSLFDAAESAFGGPVHVLVAAAGVQDPAYPTLAQTSLGQWERTFDVNARGTFLCCREGANRIVRGGGGRIVTMSSSNVGSLRPGYGAYASTKAAVEAMTKILAKELKGTGITANAVAPGPIATPMFYAGKTEDRILTAARENPMGRLGQPADVAPVVGFLATDAGGWVNGQIIRVNGGYV